METLVVVLIVLLAVPQINAASDRAIRNSETPWERDARRAHKLAMQQARYDQNCARWPRTMSALRVIFS